MLEIKITAAQISPKTGDLTGNTVQIINAIRKAKTDNAEIIVFPETSITGYCCGDLFNQAQFINDQLTLLKNEIIPQCKGIYVVLGIVDFVEKNKLPLHNKVIVIKDDQIVFSYNKQYLASAGHHEDMKYFIPGTESKIAEFLIQDKIVKVGIPICEDIWFEDHPRNIVSEMVDLGAELILVPNYSYFYYGKTKKRSELIAKHFNMHHVAIVYVNAVGVGDILKNIIIYDGGSIILDSESGVYHFTHFEHLVETCDVLIGARSQNIAGPLFTFDKKYEQIWKSLLYVTKEYFDLVGIKNAQVHVSGGLDSAIVATIAKYSLGKERVILMTNPSDCNSDNTKQFAESISFKLEIPLIWFSVAEILDTFEDRYSYTFKCRPSKSQESCLHATMRSVQGLVYSSGHSSAILPCGNHTENILGWATFHDIGSIGLMQLIGDLTKVELFEFSKWINDNIIDSIPEDLYNGNSLPAAELPDANQDPFDYYIVSGICADLIRLKHSPKQIINNFKYQRLSTEHYPEDFKGKSIYSKLSLSEFSKIVDNCWKLSTRNIYKSAQAAPIVILSPYSRGFSSRETLINKYDPLIDYTQYGFKRII